MGIEARAASREGVVEAMAKGLSRLIFGRSQAAGLVTAGIAVRAEDPVEMLVSCLNEVVYWSERDDMVPSALHVESLDNGELRATIAGEPFDPGRHAVERQVKCVTYHQACFEKTSDGWYARVYVDL
jgi:SHS2 domain-containing protein